VKLIRRTDAKVLFHLGQREGNLLVQVLKRYPRVPSAHQRLSKSGLLPNQQENQRLLDEALAEQRADCKKQLQALLADPRRLRKVAAGFRLALSEPDTEWLLQVLNDIRVGSWIFLGSPEGKLEGLSATTAADFWAMELAGAFQMELLQALEEGGRDQ
jgi:hypothetical protein